MAHNCWFVGFRQLQVPSITFRWSAEHGGCFRDRRSHPEGGCAYGRAGELGKPFTQTEDDEEWKEWIDWGALGGGSGGAA